MDSLQTIDYNKWTLRFSEELEREFNRSIRKHELSTFQKILSGIAGLYIAFIGVEFFRSEGNNFPEISRSIIALIWVGLIFLTSYVIKHRKINAQLFLFLIFQFMYLTMLTQDYVGEMYKLYIPNLTTAVIFVIFTISGLRYVNAIGTSIVVFTFYCLYAVYGTDNTLFVEQIPNQASTILIGACIGYLLGKNKRDLFLKRRLIVDVNRQISEHSQELNEMNEVKNRLISIITHDLRTPLNSLKSLMQLYNTGAFSEEEVKPILSQISKQTNNAANFIDRVLIWTKNQMGGFVANFEPVDLKQLTYQSIQFVKQKADDKEIKLINRVDKGLTVNVDDEMVWIVLRNLLDNAIKFSQVNSAVTIKSVIENETISLAIKDSGIGIPEEQMANLFKINKQLSTGTKQEKGTGLGLSLCYEFMKKNKGDLRVESDETGTTFYMDFPLAEPVLIPA